MKTGVVFGTFNRFPLLKKAIASVRQAVVSCGEYEIVVVDGGSTDGSREWLREQPCVKLIEQEGPLTGAVAAFNLGFGYCVDAGYDYVCHLNDDAEIITDDGIGRAIGVMIADQQVGEVAFEIDLRGDWAFEYINGVPYANFGVVRRDVGMAVARAQGDETGRNWWNPIYRTYGADTEFGVWVWKLGFRVFEGQGIRVHDANELDELRKGNAGGDGNKNGDSDLFWSRWKNEHLLPYMRRVRPNMRAPRPPKQRQPHRPANPVPAGTARSQRRPGNTPK